MGSVKLLKGSEEFEMFQDYWKMMQSVWSVENTKEYWEKVVEDTDRFYRKYQTEFSKELALALANELERKQRCRVMIPAQAPETKQSRLLFKKEWVSILTDAGERVGENEETFHEVEGELIEFRETSEIVVLKGGILASVPMYRIQMLEA